MSAKTTHPLTFKGIITFDLYDFGGFVALSSGVAARGVAVPEVPAPDTVDVADDVGAAVGRVVVVLPVVAPTVAGCASTSQWNGSKLALGSTQDGFLQA